MNAHPAEPPWYGPVCPVVWEGRHREVPPYPDCVLDRAKGGGLTVQVERQIHRRRLGVIGHRPEALEPAGARTEEELFADARDHPLAVGDGPGRPVDVQDVLIAQVHGISVGAGDPVELPEMPSLPMLKTDCLPS